MWLNAKNPGMIDGVTFWARMFLAFGILGWLIWFFMKPLTPEETAHREMLAKAKLNAGTAL
jgi:hypothetical protein